MQDGTNQAEKRYSEAIALFGAALERLARGYEADPDRQRDLVQDIHFALWRSFTVFSDACSLRTWVYRVAHNTASSHVLRERRLGAGQWLDLDDALQSDEASPEEAAGHRLDVDRLMRLVRRLRPPDRQVMMLYLEGVDAAGIAEVTGLTAGTVTTRIHRIKNHLARQFGHAGLNRETRNAHP